MSPKSMSPKSTARQAGEPRYPERPPQGSQEQLRSGYFGYDPATQRLTLVGAHGFSEEYLERVRPQLVFRPGEARGLVGLVARSGCALYVPDTERDGRWIGGYALIRSAYLMPWSGGPPVHDVLALLSSDPGAFSEERRRVADMLRMATAPARLLETSRLSRLSQLERGVQRMAREIEELGISVEAGARHAADPLEGLETLAPREWEIFRRLRQGERVSTISRELFISENTVRNHLKSIFRKLGVGSQVELLEKTRRSHKGE